MIHAGVHGKLKRLAVIGEMGGQPVELTEGRAIGVSEPEVYRCGRLKGAHRIRLAEMLYRGTWRRRFRLSASLHQNRADKNGKPETHADKLAAGWIKRHAQIPRDWGSVYFRYIEP